MALASAPSTPERAIQPPFIRRSFTAPIRSLRSAPLSDGTVDGAETLYAHAAGKIVSFTNPASLPQRHSSISNGRAELQEEPVGTLPWFSSTERTIATGILHPVSVPIPWSLLSRFHRAPPNLQSPWHRLPQLWYHAAAPTIKVTVLVRRWRIQVRTSHPAKRLLSHRITTSKL